MVLWHLLGKYLQKLPGAALGWGSLALFFLSRAWTAPAMVTVGWLYPLGLRPRDLQRGLLPAAALVLSVPAGDGAGRVVFGKQGQPPAHKAPAKGPHLAGAAQPYSLRPAPAGAVRNQLSALGDLTVRRALSRGAWISFPH